MNSKNQRRIIVLILCLLLIVFCGCDTTKEAEVEVEKGDSNLTLLDSTSLISDKDKNITYEDETLINLNTNIESSESIVIANETITIKQKGTYILTGSYLGTIIIDINDTDKIKVVLRDCNITSTSAPIYVKSCDKLFITLEGENTLTNNSEFTQFDDNNIDGVIFSKEDLTINGEGNLTIKSEYGHGIVCKDDLVLYNTNITIDVTKRGIDVNDTVSISKGNYVITALKDGIRIENEDDTTLGNFYSEEASLTINATLDGIDASSTVQIVSGTYNITTGGGSINSSTKGWGMWEDNTTSAKAIKSTGNMIIQDGEFTIDSSDDALHANASMTITKGTINIASGDDGIHADTSIVIDSGNITISNSYEGIEAQNITVNGGVISITASDDGFNAAGGNDSSAFGRPGENPFNTQSDSFLTITNGTIYVNASGDGLDSNGALYVSGGEIIVEGPTNDGNGPLDYGNFAQITSGNIIAIGSKGMAQNFGNTSTQGSILYNLQTTQKAGTVIILKYEDEILMELTTTKSFNSILISTPKVESGKTYTLTYGQESVSIKLTQTIYSNGSSGGIFGPGRR